MARQGEVTLTEEDVRLILELVEMRRRAVETVSNLSNEKIAEKFDVSRMTVDRIVSGKWKLRDSWGEK